ncbi:hypothetical protein FH972_008228 [Carpinus fangiana]|uniref:DUF659 domain-containing protein n=1 Tax=Carpinus fangiana TaxID=176857 RepID=A0A5N6QY57_9ROSI|nr:hypothetical protein FH972_008228 [Carpinus fangiana]
MSCAYVCDCWGRDFSFLPEVGAGFRANKDNENYQIAEPEDEDRSSWKQPELPTRSDTEPNMVLSCVQDSFGRMRSVQHGQYPVLTCASINFSTHRKAKPWCLAASPPRPRSTAGTCRPVTDKTPAHPWIWVGFNIKCGSVSFSSLEHPKFRAFLNQVGLPAVSRREFTSARLDAKFEEAKAESEARIRDAMFFHIASDGWKSKNYGVLGEESLVNLTVNLPNGTSLYRRAAFVTGSVPSKYAEEICGRPSQAFVGTLFDLHVLAVFCIFVTV